MYLNLFENRDKNNDNFLEKFIDELKNALNNFSNKNKDNFSKNNTLTEYNLFEKKKIFLDKNSKHGNDLVWVSDENSVYISEHGDGGPYFMSEVNLPQNVKPR